MSVTSAPQVAFLILLVLGGHVGISIILSTIFLSRHVSRNPVFVNFCITWMLYTVSYTLLLYAGQVRNPHPNFHLCVAQSAMVYGSPAMAGVSVFVFIFHIFLMLRENVRGHTPFRWPRLRFVIMLAAPYIAFILVLTVAINLAHSHPHQVNRSAFYCSINVKAITKLSAGISATAITLAVVIEALIVITLYRHWRNFRATKSLNISILARTLVMVICSVISLLTCMDFLVSQISMLSYFVLACLPLSVFITFGTQSDFLHAWFFWRRTGEAQDVKDQDVKDYDTAQSVSIEV